MAALLCFLLRCFAFRRFARNVSRPVASTRYRGFPASGAAVLVHGLDAGASARRRGNWTSRTRQPSMTERARLGGTADQYLVELRAPDLIGEGQGFVPGVARIRIPGAVRPTGEMNSAPHFSMPMARTPVRHAQALEQAADWRAAAIRRCGNADDALSPAGPRGNLFPPAGWPPWSRPGRRRSPEHRTRAPLRPFRRRPRRSRCST